MAEKKLNFFQKVKTKYARIEELNNSGYDRGPSQTSELNSLNDWKRGFERVMLGLGFGVAAVAFWVGGSFFPEVSPVYQFVCVGGPALISIGSTAIGLLDLFFA